MSQTNDVLEDMMCAQLVAQLGYKFPGKVVTLIIADPDEHRDIRAYGGGCDTFGQMQLLIDRLRYLQAALPKAGPDE